MIEKFSAGVFFVLISFLFGSAQACSFNCGGTFTDGTDFGLKASSHSGFEKHSFYNMPKKQHSYEYVKEKSAARAGSFYQRFELREGDCFPSPDGGWNDCKSDRERFEFSTEFKSFSVAFTIIPSTIWGGKTVTLT